MAYIEGQLVIERVIRPQKVEELVALSPQGQKNIVFELDDDLQRNGLIGFIKECQLNGDGVFLKRNGSLAIPEDMANRFDFYQEFYGLSETMLAEIEALVQKEDSSGSSEEDGSDVKKYSQNETQEPKKKKKKPQKASRKLQSYEINIVPAGIAYVMENPTGPSKSAPKPLTPASLSSRLGAQRISLNSFALGRPAASLKSFGTSHSGPTLRR